MQDNRPRESTEAFAARVAHYEATNPQFIARCSIQKRIREMDATELVEWANKFISDGECEGIKWMCIDGALLIQMAEWQHRQLTGEWFFFGIKNGVPCIMN